MTEEKKYFPKQFWELRLGKNFTLGGVGYIRMGEEYNKWLYKTRERVLDEILMENNISCKGKRVLELAVGNGFYVDYWQKRGASEIVGVDITKRSVEELVKKYPSSKFIEGDISSNLPLQGQFDIITAFDVLFHVVDEDKFDRAIENIGKFSHEGSWILVMDSFLKKSSVRRFHVNIRPMEKYLKVFEKNKMKKVDLKPLFYLMMEPADKNLTGNKLIFPIHFIFWACLLSIVSLFNKLGVLGKRLNYLIGFTLYNVDKLILKYAKSGPSNKLMLILKG